MLTKANLYPKLPGSTFETVEAMIAACHEKDVYKPIHKAVATSLLKLDSIAAGEKNVTLACSGMLWFVQRYGDLAGASISIADDVDDQPPVDSALEKLVCARLTFPGMPLMSCIDVLVKLSQRNTCQEQRDIAAALFEQLQACH